MTRASFLLIALSSLVLPSCSSVSLGGSNESDAGGSSTSTSGSSRTDGSGGNGGTGAFDAAPVGGQDRGGASGTSPCQGLEVPDLDCSSGTTPKYICEKREDGWAWDYYCAPSFAAEALPPSSGGYGGTYPYPIDAPVERTCTVDGVKHPYGTSWQYECNTCWCNPAGDGATCTAKGCRVDAAINCNTEMATKALSAAGIVTTGKGTTLDVILPENLASGPDWGVKDIECREGGYDLSPVAGKWVCLMYFDTTDLCQQMPARVGVVMSEDTVRCIYKSADATPGVYSVHDSSCTSPDAGTASCPGPNPAERTCRTTTSECIPSTCTCGSSGSANDWRCTTDCRTLPLCAPDAGTLDTLSTCSGTRIDTTQATAAFAQHMRQIKPELNPAVTFGAEEKTVPNLWDTMQTQLFFGKMYAADGSLWDQAAFLYHHCTVTLPMPDLMYGLIDSGVVANGAFYYSWGWGSGIYRSSLGKLAADGTGLVMTMSSAYFNPGSGPPGLVVTLEKEKLVVYRASVTWGKFNEWSNPEPMGFLKDFGDRVSLVDENGKELSTTLP